MLGAKIFGLSNIIPISPSHYETHRNSFYKDIRFDARNINDIKSYIMEIESGFVFHLAAQSIIIKSYENPKKTFETNMMDYFNILEAFKSSDNKCIRVFTISDKCYENLEWQYGYMGMIYFADIYYIELKCVFNDAYFK